MVSEAHNVYSSYREMVLEHLFIGEILRYLWRHGPIHAEILKPQVDDAGYDIVIECCSITRHIQLKASYKDARRASVGVHIELVKKPSGCVIWIFFDPEDLEFDRFLWFGGKPGEKLSDLDQFKVAKHTKGDSTGRKAERPNIRLIPKGQFEKLTTIAEVVGHLFDLEG